MASVGLISNLKWKLCASIRKLCTCLVNLAPKIHSIVQQSDTLWVQVGQGCTCGPHSDLWHLSSISIHCNYAVNPSYNLTSGSLTVLPWYLICYWKMKMESRFWFCSLPRLPLRRRWDWISQVCVTQAWYVPSSAGVSELRWSWRPPPLNVACWISQPAADLHMGHIHAWDSVCK